jgi:hypothetical protein
MPGAKAFGFEHAASVAVTQRNIVHADLVSNGGSMTAKPLSSFLLRFGGYKAVPKTVAVAL